ncbi:MAG: NAD(P)-binding protein [Gammaproteobacteria bacterium]|nr:NAD(P)-binding protein [Gammaproteobacteria bacterium]MCF6362712.1 NAD(P)-binding protein [Gammaproteobacteria bacterium]
MIKNNTHPEAAVEIAGAGSAGLAAAITLAHAGRQVVVHEAHKEVGYRFDGDFQRLVGLTMKNPRPDGGSGNFHIPKSARSGPHSLVGEQAVFQDTLWGFGMRLAISSGVLAARSLLNNENYDTLWQRELKPQMETSVVNRALFSLLGNRSYGWFLHRYISGPNLRETLRQQYQPSWPKRLLDPWARYRYKSLRKYVTCDHIDCHCIWCRGECCIDE